MMANGNSLICITESLNTDSKYMCLHLNVSICICVWGKQFPPLLLRGHNLINLPLHLLISLLLDMWSDSGA